MRRIAGVVGAAGWLALSPSTASAQVDPASIPADVRVHTAERAASPPVIDGRLDDEVWRAAAWTADFVDIRGFDHPVQPWLRTRAKIAWDPTYLYVAAELEEPHLWATLLDRDAIIWRDNDFEIFIDPDGDGEAYYEYEVNAHGTVLDLFMDRPYAEGGAADLGWDMPGLRSAVHLDGTLNDPSDVDRGWTVEVAIPWIDLMPPKSWDGWREVGLEPGESLPNHIAGPHRPPRERIAPRHGDVWRIDFSRVHWPLTITADGYEKTEEYEFGGEHPEENWVWSPQGEINMHIPSRWGAVRFRDAAEERGGDEGEDG